MIDEVLGWASLGLISIGGLAAGLTLWLRPRGTRCRCAGPGTFLRHCVNPMRWLVRGACWYNLTGLKPDDRGWVRCPECGSQSNPRRAMRDGVRVRWSVVSVAATSLGIAAFAEPWIRGGAWTRPLPMVVLAYMDRAKCSSIAGPVHEEVYLRVSAGTVNGWPATVLADGLAHNLRADETHWNAERAFELLESLWPESEAALETCLDGGDTQARILAARILRPRCMRPCDRLLRACIEDLRDDRREVSWYISLGNAREAADYLVVWARPAQELLQQAMHSDDPQQRLLAAAIVGKARLTELVDIAAPILIEHLRDNDIAGDALVSAPALYSFGLCASPHLEPYLESTDPQLGPLIRAIEERIHHPDVSPRKLEHKMPRITVRMNDPLTEPSLSALAQDLCWPPRD